MTFIYCTSNCLYQRNGNCTLNSVNNVNNIASSNECVYFTQKSEQAIKETTVKK